MEELFNNDAIRPVLYILIGLVVTIIVYIIFRKQLKKHNVTFTSFLFMILSFLFNRNITFNKEKIDNLNEKRENEDVGTWETLETLISNLKLEKQNPLEQQALSNLPNQQRSWIKNINGIFLIILKEWNNHYNQLTVEIDKGWNINRLTKTFRDINDEVKKSIDDQDKLPNFIIDEILKFHDNKLDSFTNFFLTNVINSNESYSSNKITNHIILNVWVFGLCLFNEDKMYIIDLIMKGFFDKEAEEMLEEYEQLQKTLKKMNKQLSKGAH